MLAQMGVGSVHLVDADTVSDLNMGPQGYRPDQLDETKVSATAADITALAPSCAVSAFPTRFEFIGGKYEGLGDFTDNLCRNLTAVICCADSMNARREAFHFCQHFNIPAFIDTRMGAEVLRIFTFQPSCKDSDAKYESSLFGQSEAVQAPCTSRSTPYCATLAASMAVALFSKHLRSDSIPSSLCITLPALDFMVED